MIVRKSAAEIEGMARAGALLAETLAMVAEHLEPGVEMRELDRIADEHIEARGGYPTSSRFWFGRLTPAMRAMPLLALALLVTRIRADDHRRAVPLDDAAPLAHWLDRSSDLHLDPSWKPRSESAVCDGSGARRDALRRRVIVAKGLRSP